MLTLLYCIFTLIFGKTSGTILHFNFSCEDIYKHSNWHLLDNKDFCGTYDLSEPFTDEYYAVDPQEEEPPPNDYKDDNDSLPRAHARILRGLRAGKSEYPWIAQLMWHKYSKNAVFCSGSLIAKRYVLTAAHCVIIKSNNDVIETRPATEYAVRLGAHKRENQCDADGYCRGFEDFEVDEIIVPVGLGRMEGSTLLNKDIALVRLKNNSDFVSGIISPLCLPKCSMLNKLLYGNKMVVAGFGAINEVPAVELPVTLQKFYPVVKSTMRCGAYLFNRDTMVCTGDAARNRSSTCSGDSGSPLMMLTKEVKSGKLTGIYYQIGILAYGTRRCDWAVLPFVKDTVYARVAYHMRWILENIRE